jgi:hypothetical protein
MQSPGFARRDLEDLWRERVRAASQAYESAKQKAAAALGRCTECATTSEEDIQNLRRAQQTESDSLENYMKTLKTFHELVVQGKLPSE